MLRSVTEKTFPSLATLVERTMVAACSGRTLKCRYTTYSSTPEVSWMEPASTWDVRSPEYTGDALLNLQLLADMTNEVELLTDWIFALPREMYLHALGRVTIKQRLWQLQLWTQQVRNVDLLRPLNYVATSPELQTLEGEELKLHVAKDILVKIRKSHFNFLGGGRDNETRKIRDLLTKHVDEMRPLLLQPFSHSLLFGVAHGENVALGRLDESTAGMSDNRVIAKLAMESAREGLDQTLQLGPLEHLELPNLPKFTFLEPTYDHKKAFYNHRDAEINPANARQPWYATTHDRGVNEELVANRDCDLLETFLQPFRPLMGTPFGARNVSMAKLVGKLAYDSNYYFKHNSFLATCLAEQARRNHQAAEGRRKWVMRRQSEKDRERERTQKE